MSDLFFCLDCETTGLSPATAGLVEVAAVAVRDGAIGDTFSTLVWPGREYLQAEHREVLARVSGITVPELLDLATPEVIAARSRLIDWLLAQAGVAVPKSAEDWQHAPRTTLRLAAYNVSFDREFLNSTFWNLEWFLTATAPVTVEWSCLMLRAQAEMGVARWPRLPAACQFFDIPFEESHRAAGDAIAAARLALALAARQVDPFA